MSQRYTPAVSAIIVILTLTALSGCATLGSKDLEKKPHHPDPFEKFNRAVFKFNDTADRAVLKPIAKAYVRFAPAPLRKGIRNFFNNVLEPTVVVNDFLQGKARQGINDTWRFVINSTVGIVGLFDVATKVGLEKHNEDFGQTFAKWGMADGPYLVLPFFGPSNVRDGIGLFPYYSYTHPFGYVDNNEIRWGIVVLESIDTRANLLGSEKILMQAALDRYVFIREAYKQRRLNLIHDGNPPLDYLLED
ncbi:MAG TPA: VacJ family lipoprotein [Acidiferrobacteraceae bacterium]|nr:VacJ family lipoprotein [Acidiferrobacteraceae bacterium]